MRHHFHLYKTTIIKLFVAQGNNYGGNGELLELKHKHSDNSSNGDSESSYEEFDLDDIWQDSSVISESFKPFNPIICLVANVIPYSSLHALKLLAKAPNYPEGSR